jgi:hypothetical protein
MGEGDTSSTDELDDKVEWSDRPLGEYKFSSGGCDVFGRCVIVTEGQVHLNSVRLGEISGSERKVHAPLFDFEHTACRPGGPHRTTKNRWRAFSRTHIDSTNLDLLNATRQTSVFASSVLGSLAFCRG